MEGYTPSATTPRPTHVGVGLGPAPFRQGLLADLQQDRAAALPLTRRPIPLDLRAFLEDPLDLATHLVPAKPIPEDLGRHGRAQRGQVTLWVLPVDLKL
jgi:hypothetical protein